MVRVLCQNQVGGCCRREIDDLTPVEFTEGKSCSVIDAEMANRAAQALNANNDDSNFSSDLNFSGTSDSGSSSDSDMDTKLLYMAEADPTANKMEVGQTPRMMCHMIYLEYHYLISEFILFNYFCLLVSLQI